MTLKNLMSVKNSKVLIKTHTYEGAEELLKAQMCHLNNEISVLRENYNEAVFRMESGKSTLGVQYAELELDELKDALKKKLLQLEHVNSLLEDLHNNMRILEC